VALTENVTEGLMIVASGHPIAHLSPTLEELSEQFQAIAVCHLLETGEATKFRDNLARSAFARRYFLSRSAQQGNTDDRRLALSRTEAFFDALAGGYGRLAREIAILSATEWHADWEYREDFLYFRFLHRIVIDPAWLGSPESVALLDQFEQVSEGKEPSRAAVLRALIARDAQAFTSALSALMGEHQARVDARKERMGEPDVPTFLLWPRTFISIEGLALIAFARALRLEVDPDIPLTPAVARMVFSQPSVEDPFETMERLRASGA
jgi:hypothetical protein